MSQLAEVVDLPPCKTCGARFTMRNLAGEVVMQWCACTTQGSGGRGK